MDGRPRADCALGLPTDRPQHDRPNPGQPGRLEAGAPADDYFRHLYASEPDFRRLAKRDSHFAAVLQDNGQLDFSDPKATMQLTRTLLGLDFGLKLDLPEDRLCPPPGRKLCGLDVGTGASCIYPLLGTAQRPWHFVATGDRVRLLERKPDDSLIPLDEAGVQSIDFVMMNPPFYTSEDDMVSSAKKKARPPMSACTGAPVEMVCEGGEVAHVGRLLRESLVLRSRIQWYTSMFGKLTSLDALVEQLREHGIDNYAVTEFVQGSGERARENGGKRVEQGLEKKKSSRTRRGRK
ncbi:hypothetical protein CHGG_05077 [Chaetomium globosum CBS 148.51]|uniref:Uncharacterized protein n=1 Tax=Chaetomium globosum (strain ATCC 6205 / CBS 148.51 / DSM 1962 / NBRC 6347 / NRRL 1970) TaxID=306901 RepID=Q2GZG9_CHAGB|nr:uncharacterized protein CHGG_05077 [Chaetomium globosum CBS 148.51]EAQ88458.1 hypothetical protein CHGG_05077 [Chaetomium globosum CBS 148.51]